MHKGFVRRCKESCSTLLINESEQEGRYERGIALTDNDMLSCGLHLNSARVAGLEQVSRARLHVQDARNVT